MAQSRSSKPQDAATAASSLENSSLVERLNLTPNRLWLGIFGLWLFFLTGITWNLTGSPGFLQHYRVSSVLELKQHELASLELEVTTLNGESELLERSVVAQEREVRRTLGYAAPDEIIFDFSSTTFSQRPAEAVVDASRTRGKNHAKL